MTMNNENENDHRDTSLFTLLHAFAFTLFIQLAQHSAFPSGRPKQLIFAHGASVKT